MGLASTAVVTRARPSTLADALDGIATPDRRYIVVRGRLWRATNPALDEAEREQLVKILMAARRDVARARRQDDVAAVQRARSRVNRAKLALGERGPVWWSDQAPDENRRMVHNTAYNAWFERAEMWAETIDDLLRARAADASICPSEAARVRFPDGWRHYLAEVREVARHLARHQRLTMTQHGRAIDPSLAVRGPVRLRRP